MEFKIYNTLSGTKNVFETVKPNEVSIYLCGPTVYDLLHIGNFRGAIVFNVLRNWLEHLGQKVTFVYNYTDVDDKIINKAIAQNVDPKEISEKYIAEFEKDFSRLKLTPHEKNPRVTEYMDEIITFVGDLIKNKKAYEVEGEVFFEIDQFSDYGKLSKKKLDELESGKRVEVDTKKKNPFDFVLWKPSKKDEPSWESPWGKGRPGWHIECSAMIQSIFNKETIDIHGGGIDLIFPHHENEIAQGEGRTDSCYCNNWMHNNFINMKDEKMSKSLGNVITARSFMDKYSPEILKYLFLSAHYRSMLSISDDKILQAISGLERVYSALDFALDIKSKSAEQANKKFESFLVELSNKITKSLNDDLNTAEAISHIFESVRAFNNLKIKPNKVSEESAANAFIFINWIQKYGSILSLFKEDPKELLDRLDEILIDLKNINIKDVDALISDRMQARSNKDWAKADEIRDQLLDLGIELRDGGNFKRNWTIKKS